MPYRSYSILGPGLNPGSKALLSQPHPLGDGTFIPENTIVTIICFYPVYLLYRVRLPDQTARTISAEKLRKL